MRKTVNVRKHFRVALMALAAAIALAPPAFARKKAHAAAAGDGPARVTTDKTGQLETRDGMRLHLFTDMGDVQVSAKGSGQVTYHMHLEADAKDPDAQTMLDQFQLIARNTPDGVIIAGRMPQRRWGQRLAATIEVTVPESYSLDVSTQDGNIDVGNIGGRVSLVTDGGNITAGNIGGPARIVTDGGNVSVKNVAGDLGLSTGGGNITVGAVDGTAVLHTGGGTVRMASVSGVGRIETGAGNVYVGRSSSGLAASTGGGQIEIGEAAGLIRAQTGGGGIRVLRAIGPTRLDTGSGSIYLTQAQNAVRASTGSGGITAWFGPGAKLEGPCRLVAGEGDIVVYLPQQMQVTVDAQVELGSGHRVIVDPAFPLKVTYGQPDENSQAVRAEGTLNGGGAVLMLRTISGNIRLMLNNAEAEKRQMETLRQQMDQLSRQLGIELGRLNVPMPPPPPPQNPEP